MNAVAQSAERVILTGRIKEERKAGVKTIAYETIDGKWITSRRPTEKGVVANSVTANC